MIQFSDIEVGNESTVTAWCLVTRVSAIVAVVVFAAHVIGGVP